MKDPNGGGARAVGGVETCGVSRSGVVRCLVAAVLFGASAPAASKLAGDMPPFVLAGLLYIGAGLGVLPAVVRMPPSAVALRREWRPALVAVVAGGGRLPVGRTGDYEA